MTTVNPYRVGMVAGIFLGTWHLIWSIMVAAGIAQGFMTWILKLHFINISFGIAPFDLKLAAGLVVVTSVFGYLVGWFLGTVWNYVSNKK